MLNTNCTALKLIPGKDGQLVRLHLNDPWMASFVRNEVQSKEYCPADGAKLKQRQEGQVTVLSGCLRAAGEAFTLKLPLRHPEAAMVEAIRYLAKEAGVDLKTIAFHKLPAGELVYAHQSATWQEISVTMLSESDNLMANRLFAAVMAQVNPEVNEWKDAGKVMQSLVSKHYAVNAANITLYDGAGISYYNHITALYLANLLAKARTDPVIYPLLEEALPKNGSGGTLANRLPHLPGKIYAKTGGLRGISNLAGFTTIKGHEELIVLLVNFWPQSGHGPATGQVDMVLAE